jgi:hypothetical protein
MMLLAALSAFKKAL